MIDSVGMQKIEGKSKQFLVEKIIHGTEFENLYNIMTEKKIRNNCNCWTQLQNCEKSLLKIVDWYFWTFCRIYKVNWLIKFTRYWQWYQG